MQYPKALMTITELVNLGYSRESLKNWVHITDFPAIRNSPRGNWKVDTSQLDNWLIRRGLMKKDVLSD